MLLEEAKWIGEVLKGLNLKPGQNVLDIGASSEYYRCVIQPYIDYYIFRPLREKGICIQCVDLQKEPGVDIVCDVSLGTPKEIFRNIPPADAVIAANLLEHVKDRAVTLANIGHLAKPEGLIILTVPHHFPYHPDPIDTMYRPTHQALEQLFSKKHFSILRSENVVSSYGYVKENLATRFLEQVLYLFGGSSKIRAVNAGPYSVACIVVRKNG